MRVGIFAGRPSVTVSMERDSINLARGKPLKPWVVVRHWLLWARRLGGETMAILEMFHPEIELPTFTNHQIPVKERLIVACGSASLPGNVNVLVQMEEILHLSMHFCFTRLRIILQSLPDIHLYCRIGYDPHLLGICIFGSVNLNSFRISLKEVPN